MEHLGQVLIHGCPTFQLIALFGETSYTTLIDYINNEITSGGRKTWSLTNSLITRKQREQCFVACQFQATYRNTSRPTFCLVASWAHKHVSCVWRSGDNGLCKINKNTEIQLIQFIWNLYHSFRMWVPFQHNKIFRGYFEVVDELAGGEETDKSSDGCVVSV
jgi:hypothetical protein